MSAHTKGPWIAATHGLSVHGVTPEGLTGPAVCMLMTKSGALDNHEANARLIAAAPKLLKALEMAVRQNDHDMLMTGEELRQCRAAIAKAEAS